MNAVDLAQATIKAVPYMLRHIWNISVAWVGWSFKCHNMLERTPCSAASWSVLSLDIYQPKMKELMTVGGALQQPRCTPEELLDRARQYFLKSFGSREQILSAVRLERTMLLSILNHIISVPRHLPLVAGPHPHPTLSQAASRTFATSYGTLSAGQFFHNDGTIILSAVSMLAITFSVLFLLKKSRHTEDPTLTGSHALSDTADMETPTYPALAVEDCADATEESITNSKSEANRKGQAETIQTGIPRAIIFRSHSADAARTPLMSRTKNHKVFSDSASLGGPSWYQAESLLTPSTSRHKMVSPRSFTCPKLNEFEDVDVRQLSGSRPCFNLENSTAYEVLELKESSRIPTTRRILGVASLEDVRVKCVPDKTRVTEDREMPAPGSNSTGVAEIRPSSSAQPTETANGPQKKYKKSPSAYRSDITMYSRMVAKFEGLIEDVKAGRPISGRAGTRSLEWFEKKLEKTREDLEEAKEGLAEKMIKAAELEVAAAERKERRAIKKAEKEARKRAAREAESAEPPCAQALIVE